MEQMKQFFVKKTVYKKEHSDVYKDTANVY